MQPNKIASATLDSNRDNSFTYYVKYVDIAGYSGKVVQEKNKVFLLYSFSVK